MNRAPWLCRIGQAKNAGLLVLTDPALAARLDAARLDAAREAMQAAVAEMDARVGHIELRLGSDVIARSDQGLIEP